jgi:sodium-dependent phosphate cotransporter
VKGPVGWIQQFYEAFTDDVNVIGGLMVATGLVIVLGSLILITKNMKTLVAERVERSMNAILGRGGGLIAMMVGLVITVAVQSSSITTSILIPMSAAGVISLRNAYPVTLGANVGTTITALLAALAASRPEALTVALVHTIFNVTGILVLYGIPFLRPLPI